MKKKIALILVLALALGTVACGNTNNTVSTGDTANTEAVSSAQPENSNDESSNAEYTATTEDMVVTEMMAGENQVLVMYPTPNRGESSSVCLSCTAPVFIIYGDGAMDEAAAKEYLISTGLADIAAQEGSAICVINPIGETWDTADTDSYGNIIGMVDDSSTSSIANGIATSVNFFTQQEEQKISGTTGRVYVYGIGTGADFVASNYIKPVTQSVTYGDNFTMEFDRTATAVTLVNATVADGIEANDMTVVAVGCSDELVSKLESSCGKVVVADDVDYVAEYASVGAYRRQAGVLVPVHNWDAEGIVETIESYTVETSSDNVTFADAATHDINYVTYYAKDLDVKNGNVPLVLCFHGGGNTALYEAQATEWPLIGKENGFITVSVDLHYPNVSAAEIVALIENLKTEYSIDSSRIYASGFSMGGCKSWDLFEQYPEVFAGLAPMDATYELGVDSFGNAVASTNSNICVPVFYVGGETSPLPELPFQEQKCVDRMGYVFSVNGVTKTYDVSYENQDSWENPIWGVNGDLSYNITDTTFTDSTLAVQLFASNDGKYYTAFASAGNQSHEVYARNSWAAYDFLSQFSRAEDGSIVISDVNYSRPSDDGNVAGNTYNQ